MVWADINGDRLPVFSWLSGKRQLTVFFQKSDAAGGAENVPTLTGSVTLPWRIGDGDGAPEIFLLSADERQVGVTRSIATAGLPSQKSCRWKDGRWRWPPVRFDPVRSRCWP